MIKEILNAIFDIIIVAFLLSAMVCFIFFIVYNFIGWLF